MTRSWLAAGIAVLAACETVAQEPAPLTLPEAVAWALDHSPRLAAAAMRVEEAEGRVAVARAPAQPAFKLAGAARLQGPVQEITIPGARGGSITFSRSDFATASFGVVWPLWTGGRVKAATGAARAQVGAAEGDLQQATEQLIYEVGLAWFRVFGSRSALADARAGSALAQETLRTVQARRAAGIATGAEVSRAEAAHSRAEQLAAAAENAVADAEQALNTLLARPLTEPVVLVDAVLALDCPSDPAEAEAVALAVRPELLALASRREAAEQAIRQARAERNPTVAAVGQVAVQTPTAVTESHSEFIGIEFAWPVLNHPASRGNERVARSTVREVDELRADLENVIRLQVSDSARRLADAEEALAGAGEALRAAQDAEGQAQAAREQGAATAEQLAAAQAALDQAQARRTQAECARSAAWLSRGRALGLLRTLFLLAPEEVTP